MQASAPITQLPARRLIAPEPCKRPSYVDVLKALGSVVRFRRDEDIFVEGDPNTYCYRLITGCARTITVMEDGRRQVNEFLLAGDLLGFDDLGAHAFSAEAVTEIVALRFPRNKVEALADCDVTVARQLHALALQRLRIAHERLVLLGRKTATERLASFILELDRRNESDGGVIPLAMGRIDIADHLGLTVETVCRVLAIMKRDGAIGLSRRGVQILSRAAVTQLALDTRH
jgi:CRP/FNR family transcriptional regulator, nitrogen fixation regulation protein